MANQQLRNVTDHVVIQSELNPGAKLRNVTGHVVIQRDSTARLFGGEAVWREGDETNIAPHVDISQPMQLNLPNSYIDTECTLLAMYSDGSFDRRFVTPDQSPWTVPVTGEINQLAFFKGELVPVTIEAIRRGMSDLRFESDESDPVDPDPGDPDPQPTTFIDDFSDPVYFNEGVGLYHESPSTTQRRAISLDEIGEVTDVEILARVFTSTHEERFGIIVRGSGSEGSETGYVWQTNAQESRYDFSRYLDGNFNSIIQEGYASASRRVWLRIRIEGDEIKTKIWDNDLEEPVDWDFEVTNTEIPSAGWVGLFGFDGGSGSKLCDWFGVGLNGAQAPSITDTLNSDQKAATFESSSQVNSDWTKRWDGSGDIGTYSSLFNSTSLNWQPKWFGEVEYRNNDGYLRPDTNDSGRIFVKFVPAGDDITDFEIYAECRGSSTSNNQMAVRGRASGENLDETQAIYAEFAGGDTIQLRQYTPGGLNTLESVSFSWSTNTWYSIRFRVVGSDHKVKVWPAGDPEPSDWLIETVNNDHVIAGSVGVGSFTGAGDKDFRFFEVEILD